MSRIIFRRIGGRVIPIKASALHRFDLVKIRNIKKKGLGTVPTAGKSINVIKKQFKSLNARAARFGLDLPDNSRLKAGFLSKMTKKPNLHMRFSGAQSNKSIPTNILLRDVTASAKKLRKKINKKRRK